MAEHLFFPPLRRKVAFRDHSRPVAYLGLADPGAAGGVISRLDYGGSSTTPVVTTAPVAVLDQATWGTRGTLTYT